MCEHFESHCTSHVALCGVGPGAEDAAEELEMEDGVGAGWGDDLDLEPKADADMEADEDALANGDEGAEEDGEGGWEMEVCPPAHPAISSVLAKMMLRLPVRS